MKKSVLRVAIILTLIAAITVCFSACSGEVTVNIHDKSESTEITVRTNQTIADILAEAGISLNEKDESEPALNEKLGKDVTEITVKRYAKVSVIKGDDKTEVEVVGGTVEDAVKMAGIELSEDDELSVEKDAYLEDGMEITVTAIEYKTETRTETIEFETKEENDSSITKGESVVKQEGVNGEKEVTVKVKYINGEKDSEEIVSEKVTKEPVDKIVANGTKAKSSSSGKKVVSKQAFPNCADGSHGYYEIHYDDGSVEYVEY